MLIIIVKLPAAAGIDAPRLDLKAPSEYVEHNVPLLVLSGLGNAPAAGHVETANLPLAYRDGALRIHGDLPPVTGPVVDPLLKTFKAFERRDDQWDAKPVVDGSSVTGFKFRITGRTYDLPPRKAKPPTQEQGYDPPTSPTNPRSPPLWILHSPISPLTPGASLFPDGVISPEWIRKHQHFIPSVFMSFFDFAADPATNSLTDNQLKSEINNIKATLYRSEYKTKLVVVLIGDATAVDTEERLSHIRRATGLDSKTSFFFLPPDASAENVHVFVDGVLTTLQPGCVEYYRDLTKHTRRKKARGNIPAPTAPPTRGTSQTLSSLGWSIRYDFKLAVFAEFRQEMESACRHYTSALESLLGPDGIFETTASWSPRWEESRILADMVAMRILRCLLWSGITTAAVQSWSNYRYRLRELIDRKGKGSTNYGWEAWESRWSRMMAELVRRTQVSVFALPSPGEFTVYAPVEKLVPVGERIRPFDHLHHPGYWYRISVKHARRRRRYAVELLEEDSAPPGHSPASAMASRYGTYETYLCPEPWQEKPNATRKTYNHSKEIFHTLEKASKQFKAQPRSRDELCLEMARELIRNRQYPEAMKLLFQLWKSMSWRRDQWWELVFEVTRHLRDCAKQLGDGKVLAATEFEMLSGALPPAKGHVYNLMRCGNDMQNSDTPSLIDEEVVNLDVARVSSFINATLTFKVGEGNAGEPLQAQLVMSSSAQPGSASITFESIDITLHGSPLTIGLVHVDGTPGEDKAVEHVQLLDQDDSHQIGKANLQLEAEQSRVFGLSLVFREAGPVAVESIALTIQTPVASIRFTTAPQELAPRVSWYKASTHGWVKSVVARDDSHAVQIHPRPPKMEIKMPRVSEHFYTDEEIELPIELVNGEDEATESSLEVRILSNDGPAEFHWLADGDATVASRDLPGHQIGTLERDASKTSTLVFAAPSLPTSYIIEVKVLYHLSSDPATPVSKIFTADLDISRAFEANYEFQPRVHPAPWPSFFDPSTIPTTSGDDGKQGLIQRWELLARIASFTYEGVIMSKAELRQESISAHATATLTPTNTSGEETEVAPQQQIDRSFTVNVAKTSLEDRRAVELELVLAISWHRPRSTKIFTSLLPVNNFILENGPRVLASLSYPALPKDADNLAILELAFTLENPTNHFLTFELSMEGPPKDEWALSGSKMSTLNLLPLSREVVRYRLVPLGLAEESDGQWMEVRFRVMDVYFRKVLRCLAAGDGVREVEGKTGGLLVWAGGDQAGVP